ncbi:methyltransferase family protein [Euzebyella saccharophila]|uniref:Methyltransferase family protein n=1 Tax=Euzebyella saccharophila TaxID=679664 RepID=A0ABV8JW02_9FLAO|nr:isoprenylcysteine carboxylmethyltransferase family protein [Euzebyella saccharophila]
MQLKVPPVIVFLFFSALMFLLAKVLPVGYFDFFGRTYLMIGLLVMASIVVIWALFQFYSRKTTVDPRDPSKTTTLVDSGVYAYSRNPMYLAMLMVLLAFGLWLGNAFNTLLAAGFVGYMNRFQIEPEERSLESIFGKEYRQYCLKVRRWF